MKYKQTEPTAKELMDELKGLDQIKGYDDIIQAYLNLINRINRSITKEKIVEVDRILPNNLIVEGSYDLSSDITDYYIFFRDEDGTLYSMIKPEFMQVCDGCNMPLTLRKVGR